MMPRQKARKVNVVPNIKIKKEVPIEYDEDDYTIGCKVCSKVFASDMALRNHARMEHIEVFATGDPALWMQPQPKENEKAPDPKLIKIKTEQIIQSMEPTDLFSLASDDVSYIIIKAEEQPTPTRKRKAEKEKDGEKAEKAKREKEKEKPKEREVKAITGPFECLQPSTLVADGTCHQIFFSCCEYSVHFRDEHTRRRKGLRCQVCEKPLVTNGEIPLMPFNCEVCGAGFTGNKDLSSHMATDHVKLKPFQCGVCQKRFTQQSGVQQHMRMHTGDRPFSCTFCPKSFTQKSGLDQHLRIHTKVKPYRCVICSKTFCQSVHLRQHMRTHTNVSPFQCGICSKRFKQSSHLNYHLKNHNMLNMTEEQKVEYRKLVEVMMKNVDNNTIVMDEEGNTVSVVANEEELHTEEVTEETEEITEDMEETEVYVDEEEQMLAEQSIVQQTDDEFILGTVIEDDE